MKCRPKLQKLQEILEFHLKLVITLDRKKRTRWAWLTNLILIIRQGRWSWTWNYHKVTFHRRSNKLKGIKNKLIVMTLLIYWGQTWEIPTCLAMSQWTWVILTLPMSIVPSAPLTIIRITSITYRWSSRTMVFRIEFLERMTYLLALRIRLTISLEQLDVRQQKAEAVAIRDLIWRSSLKMSHLIRN